MIKKSRTLQQYLFLGLKGFCMGAADVVPGVSGGTMAFILGIYQELIASIKSLDRKFVSRILSGRFNEAMNSASWKFLIAVAVGILTAIFSIARILSHLLETQPVLIWSFFFGLVAATVVTVCLEIKNWRPRVFLGMIAGTFSAYWVVGMVPVSTPETWWFLFFSGALAICAMILPGISGAFILVLLGKYEYVLNAVNTQDFQTLFFIAAGACMGLLSFVRLLHWLFEKYREMTIAILAGLLVGSLRKIWPWKEASESFSATIMEKAAKVQVNVWPDTFDWEVLIAVSLMLVGAVAVISIERLGRGRKN